MYITRDKCGYCNRYCSRESKDEELMLYTPDILGMKQIVCGVCMKNIQINLAKMYTEMAKSEIK